MIEHNISHDIKITKNDVHLDVILYFAKSFHTYYLTSFDPCKNPMKYARQILSSSFDMKKLIFWRLWWFKQCHVTSKLQIHWLYTVLWTLFSCLSTLATTYGKGSMNCTSHNYSIIEPEIILFSGSWEHICQIYRMINE